MLKSFKAKQSFKAFVAILNVLRSIRIINVHTEQETAKAKSLLLPYCEQYMTSNAHSHLVQSESRRVNMLNCLLSDIWNGLCSGSDCMAAKLKQVTYLHTFGYYQASLAVLDSVVQESFPIFMSLCKCREGSFYNDEIYGGKLSRKVQTANLSDDDFRKRYWAPCVIFLPTEQNLIPQALQYEMWWSVCMPKNSRDGMRHSWYDSAAVDSRILLYFLRYLNFHKFGSKRESKSEIVNLAEALTTDCNFGTRKLD